MRDEMKKVPRLRFRGFQEDWEQRKFKDIVDVRSGRDYKHLNEGNIPVYGTGGYMLSVDEALSYSEDAIGIGRKGTINKPYLLQAPFWTVDTLFYSIPIEENNLFFVNNLFQRINWKKYDESTGVPSLSKAVINKIAVKVPKIKEQSKIGDFFKQLDDTIALHQRKLYQLKELKKAYLKAMFVSMNTKNNKVPKLRFTDFEGDWEHRKLDDSIKVMDGDRGANYPHDTDFFKDGDTLFLDTGNVTKNGFKFDSVKYITNEKDEQLRAGKLEKNDFVLTSRGTLGNVGFYDEVVYNLHPKIRINSAMLILRNTDEQLSYSYLHTLLKGQLISDFMKKNQVGSAQPHITKSEFLKLNLNVPCNINEQNKIGNFFKSLDVTITLHQNKLEQLKDLKTSYLQNMFI
ncbi:restriction endonuclease subunit S [Enterococcus faecalis]|nr:restriction endonuclease subunit S [Enterococcus faecalis]